MKAPRTGRLLLPQVGPRHALFLSFAVKWLAEMIEQNGITEVVAETPFFGKNPEVCSRAYKLLGAIELACHDRGVRCREATMDDWRQHFVGFCRAPKSLSPNERRKHLKNAALDACAARGWNVETDDEAEACGILDYVLSLDNPSYGAHSSPLLAAAR